MIITPLRFTPAIELELLDDAIVHLFVRDALVRPLLSTDAIPWREYRLLGVEPARVHSIGQLDGVAHLAVSLDDGFAVQQLPEGWKAAGLRNWFGVIDDNLLAIAMRAVQLLEWDRTHVHCGACATPTERLTGERARRCPSCSLIVYPRISPAMMALVTRGDEFLLGRGINFPPGRYSALAGFLEAGESVEDAIRREVMEEVNVEVKNLQYFGSQSWPFPNSLMLAFTAEYAGGELRHDPKELADAQWFPLDALPQLPPRLSIARALIDHALGKRARAG